MVQTRSDPLALHALPTGNAISSFLPHQCSCPFLWEQIGVSPRASQGSRCGLLASITYSGSISSHSTSQLLSFHICKMEVMFGGLMKKTRAEVLGQCLAHAGCARMKVVVFIIWLNKAREGIGHSDALGMGSFVFYWRWHREFSMKCGSSQLEHMFFLFPPSLPFRHVHALGTRASIPPAPFSNTHILFPHVWSLWAKC